MITCSMMKRQNLIHEEIKNELNKGNAYYRSAQK
jgi:hypothetical protein